MKITLVMVLALMAAPALAGSQQTASPLNPAYVRAQSMVNDGNVAGGRAVVDSMIAAAPPGSNEFAEGVYWRAVLAATAADAEMDYRRVAIEYPRSPRAEDALIRLAQLEISRGNYDGALKHLGRLSTEHPFGAMRARGSYWTARALFDKNDVQGGCAATADALSRTSEGDTEFRNQIGYLNQRCAGIELAQTAAPEMSAPAPATGSTTASQQTPPPAASVIPPPSQPVTAPVTTPVPITPAERVTPKPVAQPVAAPPVATGAKTPTPAKPIPQPVAEPVRSSARFSVQIAAYNTKAPADAMVTKLSKSGYEARVDGTVAPFRVRIGSYSTRAQAGAVQRSLKAKQIEGIVVQADVR